MTDRLPQLARQATLLTQRNVYVLLLIIVVASSLLIAINYFTIKTLSAVRAYTSGESQYSKGQKDATLNLLQYLATKDSTYFALYKKEIAVPISDSIARVALTNGDDEQIARRGFLGGNNHPDDIDNLVWMLRNFKSISFMRDAIAIWQDADEIIGRQYDLALQIHHKIRTASITAADQRAFVDQIHVFTRQLTVHERQFTTVLGGAARRITGYLFYSNVVLTLLIIGSALGYTVSMMRRIIRSQHELERTNNNLSNTNHELDNFVYSASHDLRAPLTSLKGLIEIARMENDAGQLQQYFDLMQQSLEKQDQFINDIIEFSKNKRVALNLQPLSLASIIDDAINQHRFMQGADKISISKSFRADTIVSDHLRLNIVLNNLISNAIKYSDPRKEARFIDIATNTSGSHHVITVKDNGIGIRANDLPRIFDMFFVTQNSNKGTGIGLYIVREAVQKLGGTIAVESEKDIGTTFTIQVPNHENQMQIPDRRR